jgi:hypothetical protein
MRRDHESRTETVDRRADDRRELRSALTENTT